MKCERCGRDIPADERQTYQGKTLCEECYIAMISPEKKCDPWATYLAAGERGGNYPRTTANLTDLQKSMVAFIKESGRATRDEIGKKFHLSAEDLDAHLQVIMHAELVKEQGAGGDLAFVPVPVPREA